MSVYPECIASSKDNCIVGDVLINIETENVELPLYSRLHRRQVLKQKQKQPHLSKIDFCSYDGACQNKVNVKHHCSVLDAWLCPEPSIKTENNV